MASFRVRIHRIVSWTLVVAFLTTIITGYAQTQNWFRDQYLLSKLHRIFEWIFLPLLIYHTVYVMFFVKIKLEKLVTKIKQRRGTTINSLRLVQKLSSWLILVFAVLIILSGLNGYVWFANTFGEIIPFTWHTTLDALLTISIFIHIAVGLKFFLMRRRVRKKIIDYTIVLVSVALIAGTIYLQIPSQGVLGPPPSPDEKTVTVNIAYEDYEFYTSEVETVRPDIFQPGYFSMFDVLVHLDEKNSINLEYHFDESMNTHVIDSLNGQTGWWYNAFYSGGWRETNAFRMDHYPWKNGTTLEIVSATEKFLEKVHNVFREEVIRKENNSGNLIIPSVTITGRFGSDTYYDIEITAHNLRNDTFQIGVITAIDVIMSMGDQGLLNYTLAWYDSIGSAKIVRNYWVEGINDDMATGTCGFVYESGSYDFEFFAGNHIHIPQDHRPLNSPAYYLTFWICL